MKIFSRKFFLEVVLKKHALDEGCKTTAMGSRVGVESSSFFCWKEKNISRKDALKKIGNYGKYATLTALGTYMILHPKKAQASSPPSDPGDGF